MRLCSGAGCRRAVPNGVRFCDECKPEHKQEQHTGWNRAKEDPFLLEYKGRRWNKGIRPIVMQRYPLCAACGTAPSDIADHEIPARLIVPVCRLLKINPLEKYPGFYIIKNVRGLCHPCHIAKSKVEDAQDWTEQLVAVLSSYLPKELSDEEKRARVVDALKIVRRSS